MIKSGLLLFFLGINIFLSAQVLEYEINPSCSCSYTQNCSLNWSLGVISCASYANHEVAFENEWLAEEISTSIPEKPKAPVFSAYPNPVSDIITVEIQSIESFPKVFAVHDLQGREVLRYSLDVPVQRFDLSSLQHGVYFIRIFGAGTVFSVKKLIKLQ